MPLEKQKFNVVEASINDLHSAIQSGQVTLVEVVQSYLDRVKAISSCPFIVGFGIKTNDDVKWFNRYSNGAVVGSHILNHINADEDYVLKANKIIDSLSKGS